jgi:MFS family permease
MSWSLGILLGPALGGWILQSAGGHVLWSGCGIIGCLVAIAFWLFFDRIPIEEVERNQELESRS